MLAAGLAVLILVVMEYTQWAKLNILQEYVKVLILVVMEYTQWAQYNDIYEKILVLILVVMEYTQWVVAAIPMLAAGLNPCCNGIYSMSFINN